MSHTSLPVAWLKRAVSVLSSLGLAAAIFIFLLILTYLGTVEQVESGLFEAQKKYFESIFLIHSFWGVPVPLPGVYLLLILLFVNILLGGLLRMRKGWNQIGIFIIHGGILLLLLGGLITFKFATDGHMTLYEHERSNRVQSYHEWEIAITGRTANGQTVEYIVPGKSFTSLRSNQSLTFQNEDLSFNLVISDFAANSTPQPKGPMVEPSAPVVDGYYLAKLPQELEHERNIAGAYALVTPKGGGEDQQFILWGMQKQPAKVTLNGEEWSIDLRRRQWEVPFTVVLDDFRRELHPRMSMAKAFESDILKIENGAEQKITISMNQPLRYKGFTFFQASWGPEGAGPNDKLFSTFAVVQNPADRFPLYSCVVITFGMLVHFSLKLRKYLRAESRRNT